MYEPRWYREELHKSELKCFTVTFREADLWVGVNLSAFSQTLVEDCQTMTERLYAELQQYIIVDPGFQTSLVPYPPLPGCPEIAAEMAAATYKADVGPMAAVAGAFAQHIGRSLAAKYPITDIIIENGGDIYLHSSISRRISIWAGASPLSCKLALDIAAEKSPLGICTSSGTVGHSLSFGKADAVTILAKDTLVADAYATAVGNMVKTASDIDNALEYAATQPDIIGAVVIIGDRIGLRGDIKISKADNI